jgi:leucine-zipper-like transcriptional regulator 1
MRMFRKNIVSSQKGSFYLLLVWFASIFVHGLEFDEFLWSKRTASSGWSSRIAHSSIVFNGAMWVIGGNDGNNRNDVWYSSDGIIWTRTTADAGWSGRSSHCSILFDNKMWVMGGKSAEDLNDVWYSSDGVTWTQATAAAPWRSRHAQRCACFDNKMWVVGGTAGYMSNETCMTDVWYSTDGIAWFQIDSTKGWSGRLPHAFVEYNTKLWLTTGDEGLHLRKKLWYSSNGITWTQSEVAAAWNSRYSQTGVIFDNRMWVMGSFDGSISNGVWFSNSSISWTDASG